MVTDLLVCVLDAGQNRGIYLIPIAMWNLEYILRPHYDGDLTHNLACIQNYINILTFFVPIFSKILILIQ